MSLYILSMINLGKLEEAAQVTKELDRYHNEEGLVYGPKENQNSITGSQGKSLKVETTALAIMAYIRTDYVLYRKQIELSVKYISSQVSERSFFYSTQATYLCLRALVDYYSIVPAISGSGDFALYLDGKLVERKPFDTLFIDDPTTISFYNFSQSITEAYDGKANDFNIQIIMENGRDLDYT